MAESGERRVESGGRRHSDRGARRLLPVWIVSVLCILLASAAVSAVPFRVDESEKDYITVYEGAKPVFRYIRGEILPEGAPEDRRRSTYVDPVYSIDGKPISEDAPKDHWHHRGLSWMWPKVRFDGVTRDLWTLKGVRQHYVKHEAQVLPDRVILMVTNFWDEDGTDRKLLDEVVTLTTHKSDSVGRVIDFELRLTPVDVPVALGTSERGYGGLQIRFGPRQETTITTNKGPVKIDVDRQRFTWADLSARFNGSSEFDGIAIFDNRQNPHFPSGWTLRPYGVLDPAFTSTSTDYTIEPGKPLTLKYRIYVHKGKADQEALHRMFDHYLRGG